jgi:nucleotide-binding universal stress UspA family protein
MKTIVVPVDFSTVSTNAAEFAGNLAAFYGGDILLYHTYELPMGLSEYAFPIFSVDEMQSAALHELAILKENTQSKLRGQVTINVKAEITVLEKGLEALCDEINPSLVVMGLTGKNALTRLIVGSNTIKAINYLKYPVLVVPPQGQFTPIQKIGFACDYKEVAANTPLTLLKKIVADFRAELHVVNVDFNNKNFEPGMVQESFTLNELLQDVKPVYHNIEAQDVTEGLNSFAASTKIDWIVVIPKKHSLVQKIFARSHSEELLYHTTIPILCVHE